MRNLKRYGMVVLVLAVLILAGCKRDETEVNDPAQKEAAYSEWVRENAEPILSLTSDNYDDLQFLKPLLESKRIVQLGESGHGVKEFNMMKVRLIKFLHREMGYDIIAFESGIFECFNANRNIPTLTAERIMRNSIFPVWHTREGLRLFDYIKETYDSERPLILAGFDTQMTSRQGVAKRPAFLRDVVAAVDPVYAEEVYNIDYSFVHIYLDEGYGAMETYVMENKDALTGDYENMVAFFDTHKNLLLQAYAGEPLVPLIARQTAWSVTQFLEQVYYADVPALYPVPIRDKGMADNVEYLLNVVYPDKKIINWAHNAHIRHNNDETINLFSYHGTKMMGTWLLQRHPDELYTIGIYMHQGEGADNVRKTYQITPPTNTGHLCYVLSLSGEEMCFTDMANQMQSDGNAWMFEEIIARDWGMTLGRTRMVLRDQYHGILFINHVTAPDYLPRDLTYGTLPEQ
ncbi:MAG: erythromycin esterase family protein [bacterium]|nr:erythromycin esterase family protein [bacterium]